MLAICLAALRIINTMKTLHNRILFSWSFSHLVLKNPLSFLLFSSYINCLAPHDFLFIVVKYACMKFTTFNDLYSFEALSNTLYKYYHHSISDCQELGKQSGNYCLMGTDPVTHSCRILYMN